MSEIGKTCLWRITELGATSPPWWCGKPGFAVVTVPPRDGHPSYEMTLCRKHKEDHDRGVPEGPPQTEATDG